MAQSTLEPGKSAHSDVSDKVQQDAETVMTKAAEAGSEVKTTAKAKAKEKTDEGTGIVADEMESVARAAQSAARTLDEEQHSLMSEKVGGWAHDLATFAADRSRHFNGAAIELLVAIGPVCTELPSQAPLARPRHPPRAD